ncbi:MAG: HAMP domain-containing histidine kinase [Planctomycetes bacterium]|nr:HAMP domain-containing histidine kinase [Planctomycetota bacterium]
MNVLQLEPERRLTAVLGHELRNPLAAAITGVTLAAELTDAHDPRREFLDRALGDLQRLAGLLRTYLEFGRTGRPRPRAQDLGELLQALARRHGPRVVARVPAGPLTLRIDRDLVERSLDNLVENALAAGAREVRVSVTARADATLLEVEDDGPGVPHEVRARLFEPFVSGRGSSGLGLALVRAAVEAHGGSVTLQPSLRGAHFVLAFPPEP